MTSFLKLMDIISLEKTCQLFNDICKRNTHEIIDTNLYGKYANCYQNNQTQQEQEFKLKHIRKLLLHVYDNRTLKLFTPMMGFHTNLIHFELDFYLDVVPQNDSISTFSSNIPNSIRINKLSFTDHFYECLIPKVDGQLALDEVKLTVKQLNLLNNSNIKEIELWDCEFQGDISDINKINLKNWYSLQKCCLGFNSMQYNDVIYQSLLLHPPNLSTIQIHGVYGSNPSIPTKFKKY